MSKKSSPLSRKGLPVFALLAAAIPGLPVAAAAAPECTPKAGTTELPAECRKATNPCAPAAKAKPANPCAPAAKAKPANPCAPARKAKPANPCAPSRADR
jgi:translation initiation factor IF-2